jgi:rod shape-determining protein MreC
MAYQRRTRRLVMLLAAIGLLFLLHRIGWLAPVENALRTVVMAPFKALSASSEPSSVDQFAAQLSDQAALRAQKLALEVENAELRSQLSYKPKKPITAVGATIITHDVDSASQVVIVDRGTNDGVAAGQAVMSGEGIFVGKIIKVEANSSWLQLIADAQSTVGARILNKEQSLGVVEGGYGLSLRMKFIPRNEVVQVGDEVITSGLESNIPAALVIGTVTAVENEAYQPFQEAIITPTIGLNRLQQVRIITSF